MKEKERTKPAPQLLLVDCHDSFTHNLADYLQRAGAELSIVQVDAAHKHIGPAVDGLVLSPGPGRPASTPGLWQWMQLAEGKLPVLGICLGCQALAEFGGGKVGLGLAPMHGKISWVNKIKAHELTDGLPNRFAVVRYHSLVVQQLPPGFEALLQTDEGELMAYHAPSPRWTGLQYHPEAWETDHGLQLLSAWLAGLRQEVEF